MHKYMYMPIPVPPLTPGCEDLMRDNLLGTGMTELD